MTGECTLEHQAPQPTLSMRFRAPLAQLPEHFARVYGAVGAYLGTMGTAPAGPPFATYHNLDTANLDVEAGFPVDRVLSGTGDIHAGRLPEGEVATSIHTGVYQRVGETYTALTDWTHGQGLISAGPPTEFYLNDPSNTPALELRTKVVMPVEPA